MSLCGEDLVTAMRDLALDLFGASAADDLDRRLAAAANAEFVAALPNRLDPPAGLTDS